MKTIFLLIIATLSVCSAQEKSVMEAVATEMAKAAQDFLSSLSPEQREKAALEFKNDLRENWGYIPRERNGIPLEALNAEQILGVRDLLKSALSDPGLEKVDTIIALEALLGELEKRPDYRNPKAYYTSIFGTPSPEGSWSWRFEGHHISLNYTLVKGKIISVTPSFFAASPSEVKTEHAMKGSRPLDAEEDLARALAGALLQSEKSVIFSDQAPHEILTGEKRSFHQLTPVGVPTADMTENQKKALMQLITVYANRHRKELAEADMIALSKDLKNFHFGWAGGLERGQPFYYRIQGTSFLVEVVNVQNNANHIHAVWRDAKNDFGRDILHNHILHDH